MMGAQFWKLASVAFATGVFNVSAQSPSASPLSPTPVPTWAPSSASVCGDCGWALIDNTWTEVSSCMTRSEAESRWGFDDATEFWLNGPTGWPTGVQGKDTCMAVFYESREAHPCYASPSTADICDAFRFTSPHSPTATTTSAPTTTPNFVPLKRLIACFTHSCGVTAIGTIECIGVDGGGRGFLNENLPWSPSTGTEHFTSVGCGQWTTCGLTTGGAIECIGFGFDGSPMRPADTSKRFVSMGTGFQHVCGVVSDGSVECRGPNGNRPSFFNKNSWIPASSSDASFVEVCDGGYSTYTCALADTGVVECLVTDGRDDVGGRAPAAWMPLNPEDEFISISCGGGHICALTSRGVGDNSYGQAPQTNCTEAYPDGGKTPVSLVGNTDWFSTTCIVDPWLPLDSDDSFIKVAAGIYHTCAVTSKGAVECRGGREDDADGFARYAPQQWTVRESSGTAFTDVAASKYEDYTCVLSNAGVIDCLSSSSRENLQMQMNDELPWRTTSRDVFKSISAGSTNTCAITPSDGSVQCIGNDDEGKSNGNNPWFPRSGNDRFSLVSCKGANTCAVTVETGAVECLGGPILGTIIGFAPPDEPWRPTLNDDAFASVSVGVSHACAVTSIDGAIECFPPYSSNANVELPNGGQSFPWKPSVGNAKFVSVSTGFDDSTFPRQTYVCGLTSAGIVVCLSDDVTSWIPSDEWSPTAPGDTFTSVSAYLGHICAVTRIEGVIECKGDDTYGQSNKNLPWTSPCADSPFGDGCCTDAVASWSGPSGFTCNDEFITIKGPARCFTGYIGTQNLTANEVCCSCGGGFQGSKFINVCVGRDHTCGLVSNGAVLCMGSNEYGQINDNELWYPLKNGDRFIDLACGEFHTCATTSSGDYECLGKNDDGQAPFSLTKDVESDSTCSFEPVVVPPKFLVGGFAQLRKVPVGKYVSPSGDLVDCAPGLISSGPVGLVGFFEGHYTGNRTGASSSICFGPCPAGYYGLGGAASASDTCTGACPAGHYCPKGTGEPIQCPVGRYGASEGLREDTCSGICPTGTVCAAGTVLPEACSVCRPGEYMLSACSPGADTQCETCEGGRFSEDIDVDSCEACSPGRYSEFDSQSGQQSQCLKCPAGYFSNLNKDGCSPCPSGTYIAFEGIGNSAGSDDVCVKCPPGRRGSDLNGATNAEDGCVDCVAGEYQDDAGANGCKRCDGPGEFSTLDGAISCSSAIAGNRPVVDRTAQERCPRNTFSLSGSDECSPCASGFSEEGSAFCSSCKPGFRTDNVANVCVECAAGTYSSNGTECLPCDGVGEFASSPGSVYCSISPAGSRPSEDRTALLPCSKNTYSEGAADECTPCASGFSDEGSAACTACAPGFETNNDLEECVECEPGSFSSDGTSCLPCSGAGEYSSSRGSVFCATSTAGYKPNTDRTNVEKCPKNTYSEGAADECTPCASGFSDEGSAACTACLPGQRTDNLLEECVSCERGTYSSDGIKCLPCDGSGEFAAQVGAVFCSISTGGYRPYSNRTGQEQCPEDTYSTGGNDECTDCSSGFSKPGSSSCETCPPGYRTDFALKMCVICDAGTFSPDGLECTACDGDGEYSLTVGSVLCLKARAGHRPTFDRTNEIKCPKNFFSLGATDECSPCESGFSKEGSAACTPCEPGQVPDESKSKCVGCPAGEARPYDRTDCEPCIDGYVASSNGTAYCDLCPAGTRSNANHTICLECDLGSVSQAGSSECTECDEGTWQNNTECVACPAGFFGNTTGLHTEKCSGECRPGTHSYRYATKCLACEAGKHAPNATMEDCVACKDLEGFTSEEGAAECVCEKQRYRNDRGVCVPCSDGMDCSVPGNSVASLKLSSGHWRPSGDSDEVLECPIRAACRSNSSDFEVDERGCVVGNEGVLCAVCSDGYYRPSALTACVECGNEAEAWAYFVLGMLAIGVLIFLLIWLNRNISSSLLRPMISSAQNLSIILLFDAPYPEALKDIFKLIGSISLGFEVASPLCVTEGNFSFYDSLFTLVGVVCVLIVCLCMPPLRDKLREGLTWREMTRTFNGQRAAKDVFVLVLLVHPGLSGKCMQFFRCQEIDDEIYLVADFSLKCRDDQWWALLPAVLLLVIGFVLGVPLAIFAILYPRRNTLFDPTTLKPIPHALDILYRPYRPGAWYFESVSMINKVLLWRVSFASFIIHTCFIVRDLDLSCLLGCLYRCALVYFENGSVGQLLMATVINGTMLYILVELKPLGKLDAKFLNIAQILISVLLTTLALSGLAMNALETNIERAKLEGDSTSSQDYANLIEALQIILSVLTYSLTFCVGAYISQRMYRKVSKSNRVRKVMTSVMSRFGSRRTCATDQAVSVTGDVETVRTTPGDAQMKPSRPSSLRLEMKTNPMLESTLTSSSIETSI